MSYKLSHKSFLQECHTRLSHKTVPQECPTRVSHKSVPQEKSDPQECPTRLSHKSVPQECPTRVSHKSDPQECPIRVPRKECPTRVSCKSDPQECPRRVSHKSVLQECHLDICSFSNAFVFGFVGSIWFLSLSLSRLQNYLSLSLSASKFAKCCTSHGICTSRSTKYRAYTATTKSALQGPQSTAPTTKSALRGPQSTAPATKFALQGPQSTAPATKSARLPQNLHFTDTSPSRVYAQRAPWGPPLDLSGTRLRNLKFLGVMLEGCKTM